MCVPMIWKILTAKIRQEIYYSSRTVPQRIERIRQETRGTGELLYIDQHVIENSKTRQKNIAMAWIDTKKLYDMVI